MADVDKSNFLEETELKQFMIQGGFESDMIDVLYGSIMLQSDIDYNGKIDSQEFEALLRMTLTNLLD